MSGPRTEAGKRLLALLETEPILDIQGVGESIVAIEGEAVFVLAPVLPGAVLVTEEELAAALHADLGEHTDHTGPVCTACREDAAAILARLRETP